MASILELLALAATFIVAVSIMERLPRPIKVSMVTTAFLTILLIGLTQPALAGAVNGDVLSPAQRELNENLQTTPQGSQYQGIEYAQEKGAFLSDQEITVKVRQEVPDNIKFSVANGSVRISGKVSDLRTAQGIVQGIKEVPGVHEISYDLGLRKG